MATLIVGLGGTGTEIVRRVRRHWSLVGMPSDVALAIVDARCNEPQGGIIEDAYFTPVGPGIAFQSDFADTERYTRDWFPGDRLRPDPQVDFSDGCGNARANGKYFFFRFAQQIETALRNAHQSLVARRPDARNPQRGKTRIILVGSLGNGTGGGTFMDVGALAKEIFLQTSPSVECFGVFIPSSVTRFGQEGSRLEVKTAANGYAALLELQYEMNRRAPNEAFKPMTPFVTRAYLGTGVREIKAGARGERVSSEVSPIDYALLLDRYDRDGVASDYKTLLNIAAEGIAALCEGADADARFLDGLVAVEPARRLGSFGAVRLSVPAEKILRCISLQQAQRTLAMAAEVDEGRWRDLLADEDPRGNDRLLPEDATIPSSVSFFLEKVLQIKECNDTGAGDEVNQLFDRFKEVDEAILREFDQITEGVAELTDPALIANRAQEIRVHLTENLVDVAAERDRILLEGENSLWRRRPRNPQKPVEAGVEWLLSQRLYEFLEAGAFGLLLRWLQELKRQLKLNQESVEKHEKQAYCSRAGVPEQEIQDGIDDLVERANSLWAGLRKASLREGVAQVHQYAADHVQLRLWASKVEAVQKFYSKVFDYTCKVEEAVAKAFALLQDPRMQGQVEKQMVDLSKELDDSELGAKSRHGGLKAEFYLGGQASTRDALLAEMEETPDLSTRALLAAAAEQNVALVSAYLDEFSFNDGKPGRGRLDAVSLIDNYREVLVDSIKSKADRFVGSRCHIDRVLETEARAALENYFRKVHLGQDMADQSGAREAVEDLTRQVGTTAFNHIRQLKWENKQEAMEVGILYYIAARLHQKLRYATTQWFLRPEAQRDGHIIPFAFVTYPSGAMRVHEALAQLVPMGLVANQNRFKSQPEELGDPREITIMTIELGGNLAALSAGSEKEAYAQVMLEWKDYTPHTTLAYHQVGLRYLQEGERQEERESGSSALPVLALAQVYGYVTSDPNGNYKIGRDIPIEYNDGRVVHPQFPAEYPLGRGLENVLEVLKSDDEEHQMLCIALKNKIWDSIEAEALGKPGVTPLGWDGVSLKIGAASGDLASRAQTQVNTRFAEIYSKQAEALGELAAQVAHLQGRTRPVALQ